MKVTWTKQEKTGDPKKALEMSIAKWKFFTYCTRKQLRQKGCVILGQCGLCLLYDDCNNKCPLGKRKRCYTLVGKASTMQDLWEEKKATLKDFHAAARKVYDKLKSLR